MQSGLFTILIPLFINNNVSKKKGKRKRECKSYNFNLYYL